VKEYSNWPTYPQLYVAGELIGGCDIVMEMQQGGELKQLLQEKVPAALHEISKQQQQVRDGRAPQPRSIGRLTIRGTVTDTLPLWLLQQLRVAAQ